MENDLVSIIITAFNSEKYIFETISCCLNQSYRNVEVIVVNDGSTDGTVEEVLKINDFRVQLFTQINLGIEAARNLGILKSKGTFIQFLDSDDLLSTDKIKVQVAELSKDRLKVAVCKTVKFEIEPRYCQLNEIDTEFLYTTDNGLDFVLNLNGCYGREGMVQPNAYLISRDLLDIAGLSDTALTPSPDESEFFFRLILYSHGIVFTPDVINYYRCIPNELSMSKRKSIEGARAALRTIDKKYALLADKIDRHVISKVISVQYAIFLYKYYDLYPELLGEVDCRLRKLGLRNYPNVAGRRFRLVATFFGFRLALYLRNFFKWTIISRI